MRFSSDYDPQQDISRDVDPPQDAEDKRTGRDRNGDDWAEALQAARDRANYRAQGAARLRQAGFTEQQVAKWEGKKQHGSKDGEGDPLEGYQWTAKGATREWDRGKGDDGVSEWKSGGLL